LAAAIARCCANSALTISIAGTAIITLGGFPDAVFGVVAVWGVEAFCAAFVGMLSLPFDFMFILFVLVGIVIILIIRVVNKILNVS
jgi:hypothetical protein